MPRALRLFFQLLAVTFGLALGALSAARLGDSGGWRLDMLRFLLGAGLAAAALATWGTAVFIAYFHRATWPVLLLVGVVLIAGGGFAVWCHRNATAAARFV